MGKRVGAAAPHSPPNPSSDTKMSVLCSHLILVHPGQKKCWDVKRWDDFQPWDLEAGRGRVEESSYVRVRPARPACRPPAASSPTLLTLLMK